MGIRGSFILFESGELENNKGMKFFLWLCATLCFFSLARAFDVKTLRVPNGGIQPQAQVDAAGRLHLVYYLGEPGAGDLFYVTRMPGLDRWSEPIRVNRYPKAAVSAGTIRGAQMVLGKGDRVHVAWFGSSEVAGRYSASESPSSPLLVNRLADDGESFEREQNLMTWTKGLDGGGSITADGEGRVWVAWHGRGESKVEGELGRAVFLASSMDGGMTFSREQRIEAAPPGACACCGMRIHLVTPERLHIVYRGIAGRQRPMIDLWSADGGASFQYNVINRWEIEACPMSSASVWSDSTYGVVIASEREGRIHVVRGTSEQGRLVDFGAVSGSGGAKHPSMAADSGGNLLLAWAEGAGWAKGGVLSWALLDSEGALIRASDPGSRPEIPTWSFPSAVLYDQHLSIIF